MAQFIFVSRGLWLKHAPMLIVSTSTPLAQNRMLYAVINVQFLLNSTFDSCFLSQKGKIKTVVPNEIS
jgi:hypothetical protein